MANSLSPEGRKDLARRPPVAVAGVIFDGDDTLWMTEPLYDEARLRARAIVERAGLDGAEWEACQRSLDVANVSKLGHSVTRFPTSALEALTRVGDRSVSDNVSLREGLWQAASSVFEAKAPLRQGAVEVLEQLTQMGVHLALLTKGSFDVQERRVEQSGLADYFDVIRIVDRKSSAAFRAVANALALPPHELLSVGNSVDSDIKPSVEADIYAVWIPAHVWEYEQHDPAVEADLHRIDDFNELLALVDRGRS